MRNRETVFRLIEELLADRRTAPPSMTEQTGLFAGGLGLDSLDFATLVVRLEQETGYDPFRSGQVERLPRTLGELVAIYERPG